MRKRRSGCHDANTITGQLGRTRCGCCPQRPIMRSRPSAPSMRPPCNHSPPTPQESVAVAHRRVDVEAIGQLGIDSLFAKYKLPKRGGGYDCMPIGFEHGIELSCFMQGNSHAQIST